MEQETQTPALKQAAWHAAWVPTIVTIVIGIGSAVGNYAIVNYRITQLETEAKIDRAERTTSIAANNDWKRATESRISTVEAHDVDTKEQLNRIENKVDAVVEKLIK